MATQQMVLSSQCKIDELFCEPDRPSQSICAGNQPLPGERHGGRALKPC